MTKQQPKVQSLFNQAIEIEDTETRLNFLDEACGGDTATKRRVLALLEAHSEAGNFFGGPATSGSEKEPTCEIDQQIGPYKIREKIGEGGMGVVYVAEQTEPVQRKAAIKVIKPGMDTKEVIARFEAERQALAFMEHPNIARVLDAGATESGRSYFVMELVRGIPITEYCDQMKATPHERLDLFQTVCDAVQHAHQKGIIHRDIKPSNVLVTQVGAKPVVKVIDFGLAKATSGQKLTEKTVYTGFMKLMGTPAYMSPEQAGLSGLDVDTRSDVYSLGILLYELLTGTTPLDKTQIQKQSYDELCRQIREVEAPKPSSRVSTLQDAARSTVAQQRKLEPRSLRQLLDGDLDVVVLKALEKDRERRYGTPLELSADIDRFLEDKPVQAVPPSQLYLARKYIRRHRVAMLTAAAFLTLLVVTSALSIRQAIRATHAERNADSERNAALKSERIATAARKEAVEAKEVAEDAQRISEATAKERRRLLYVNSMALADQIWNSPNGDLRKIEELLTAWIPTDDSEDLREFSWRYQWNQLYNNASTTIRETTGATISHNGKLVTANETGLHEWFEAGERFRTKWGGDASRVTFSPDGRWAAIVIDDQMRLIQVSTGRVAVEIPHQIGSFSASGELLIAWTTNQREAQVWQLSGEEPVALDPFNFAGTSNIPNRSSLIQLSDDGQSFLFCGLMHYNFVSMFSAEDNRMVSWPHRNQAKSCAWSPNGQVMASGNQTGLVYLRRRADYRVKSVISAHGKAIDLLTFSPDGTRLAVGGSDGTIDLWDTSAFLELTESAEPTASVADDKIKPLPSWAKPRLLRTIKAHLAGGVQSLVFSVDGSKLASYAHGVSKLWDVETEPGRYEVAELGEDLISGRLALSLANSERGVTVQGINSQYHEVVSGEIRAGDRIVGASDDQRGELNIGGKNAAELSQLLWGPHDSTVQLTVEGDGDDRRDVELKRNKKFDPRPARLCISPDENTVAISGGRLGTTSINLVSGQSRRYPQISHSVAISADSKLLAMDGNAGVLIWNLDDDQEYGRLGNIGGQGGSLAFSPDGKYLAIGTKYPFNWSRKASSLRVWRVSDLEEVGDGPVFTNGRVLSDITFTPDSAHLIATSHDGIVRVWDTANWQLLDRQFNGGDLSTAVAISPDGTILATGGDGQIDIWDFETGERIHALSGVTAWALDFSHDGKTLVSGSPNHNVQLWDVATGMPLRTFHAHSDAVMGVAFSSDGKKLATVGTEGVLRIWEAASFDEIEKHPQTIDAMYRLAVLRNREDRWAEAESILVKLLQIQQKRMPVNTTEIERTKSEIAVSLAGQNRLPVVTRHPKSVEANLGDLVELSAVLDVVGRWNAQWFHDEQPIDSANQSELRFKLDEATQFGAYHLELTPQGRDDVQPVRTDVAFVAESRPPETKGLRWEIYKDIPGIAVEKLTTATKYPDQPDETQHIDDFELPSNVGDNFGARVTGWLVPPVSGEYVFYLCCDDHGELWLSETESPDDERLIASSSHWLPPRLWQSGSPQSKSAPIHLQRGKRYSIRALLKDSGNADHLAVAWQMPKQPPPKEGAPPIPGMFLERRQE